MRVTYTQYFQKSKVFLYPLLRLRKGIDFVPMETYILWDGVYSEKDYKFICVYKCERNEKFLKFENNFLKSHDMFENHVQLPDDEQVYVFNFRTYKYDFDKFINGTYSKFSVGTKNQILNFFGSVGHISEYIESFLDPEQYHDAYAEALDVPLESIQDVYEVCSIPDLKKETLVSEFSPEVELLKNKYLSLEK